MNKIRLILGTINRLEYHKTQEELEEIYEYSYKPFISFVSANPNIKVVLYYSGLLLEWLEKYRPEFIVLLKELVASKRVELLTSGYYEPLFNLLPSVDQKGQIEIMSNSLWKMTKKRAHGGIIASNVWEPSFASNLVNSGIRYLFLGSENFLQSGIPSELLYEPLLTEDKGKLLTLFPVHTYYSSLIGRLSPNDLLAKFSSLYMEHSTPIYLNLLVDGNSLGRSNSDLEDFFTNNWMEEFHNGCIENRDVIENDLPRAFFRTLGVRKKVYIQCSSDESFAGMMLPDGLKQTLDLLKRHLGADSDEMKNLIQCGIYRQFLTKYDEVDRIYQKVHRVNLIISQNTKDKERRKAAKEILYKAQQGDIYSHGDAPGIYHNRSRKKIYSYLLEAERLTREKGQFRQSLISNDYNMDGVDEILFNGQHYNAYLSLDGGEIFELDYFPARCSYLDTMKRYKESYHSDQTDLKIDSRTPTLFHDLFLPKEFNLTDFDSSSISSSFTADDALYHLDVVDRDKKIIRYKSHGLLSLNGDNIEISLIKEYRFKKGIELNFEIINESDKKLNFQFSSLMNLSFLDDNEDLQFLKLKNKKLQPIPYGCNSAKQIGGFTINDLSSSTQIEVLASRTFSMVKESVSTKVFFDKSFNDIFQHYSLLPLWNVSIRPKSSWKLNLSMNLAKK